MYERNAIPDDPIIQAMEATGYPPWVRPYYPGCPSSLEDEDDYIGIGHSHCDSAWEEEDPEEHDDYYRHYEPVAVYEGEDYDDF